MAARTPTLVSAGDPGFIDRGRGIWGGAVGVTETYEANGVRRNNRQRLKLQIYHFTVITDTDTWTSNDPGIFAVAWQGNDVDAAAVNAHVSTQATGVVTFNGAAAAGGWLWVLTDN